MATRRDLLKAGAAANALATGLPRALGAAPVPLTPVDFDVPRGACDWHVQAIPDQARFPFSPSAATRRLPPVRKSSSLFQEFLRLDGVAIVTPGLYGAHNSATLAGMRELGPQRAPPQNPRRQPGTAL